MSWMAWRRGSGGGGRAAPGVIGIDVGTRCVKLAQMEGSAAGTRRRLCASAALRRPAEGPLTAEEGARLAEVIERRGFRGRRVVVSAPAASLAWEMLDLPPRSSGAPIGQIARAEVAARCAALAERPFAMGSWDLPAATRGGGNGGGSAASAAAAPGTSLMAVALAEDVAEGVLEALEGAGLEVVAIEPGACALARAVTASGAAAGAAGIVPAVDIGWSAAAVVLVGGEGVLYQRTLPGLGLGRACTETAERFGTDVEAAEHLITAGLGTEGDERRAGGGGGGGGGASLAWLRERVRRWGEELAEELRASLAYAGHRYGALPAARPLFAGGGASVAGLLAAVGGHVRGGQVSAPVGAAEVGIEEGPSCGGGGGGRPGDAATAALLATALGLARWGEEGGGRA